LTTYVIPYNDVQFFENVGRGAYATVFRGRWKPMNRVVAIKVTAAIDLREVCQLISLRL